MSRYDFDVFVIGGGAAGLTASGLAASLGARTALVEAKALGGDCTWHGCIPSKALIRAASVAHTMRTADRFGIEPAEPRIDFARVMEGVRSIRRSVYEEADAPDRVRERGVTLFEGRSSFVDPHTVTIEGDESRSITARYFIICTGSSPVVPKIPGLAPELVLTNESIFELDERPERLAVLGAGPIGIEMAQAFQRLGSRVTVIEERDEILSRDEPECAARIRETLVAEGVEFHLGCRLDSVSRDEQGNWLQISRGDEWKSVRFDRLLTAVGRRPNIGGMGLDAAGVAHDERGITINHSCQTSAPHIYACGDVAEELRFTHVAENMAKTAVVRLLLKVPSSYEREVIPWVTFTSPESAHLGRTASELREAGIHFDTITFPYEKIDRAATDRTQEGVVILHASAVSGKLHGAHIVGERAGEMINELALAMQHGLTLRDIADTVHAYPTYLLGVRRAADQWYVRRASPGVIGIVKSVFGYRGSVSKDLGSDSIV